MLKMTRREAFEIDISFDDDPSVLLDLGITFVQDGRTVLERDMESLRGDLHKIQISFGSGDAAAQ